MGDKGEIADPRGCVVGRSFSVRAKGIDAPVNVKVEGNPGEFTPCNQTLPGTWIGIQSSQPQPAGRTGAAPSPDTL